MGKKYNKQIGFRVQMRAPDYKEEALPEFVLEKVPMLKLTKGKWREREFSEPRYDHPAFQDAYKELNGLLAAELNGNPLIEFMDTFMNGFWGEGHTWPFTDNPFPDYAAAERTWMHMLDIQLEYWTKTPLVTNTQPDFSVVGDAEMLDRSIRTHNWVRTDSILVENMQIEPSTLGGGGSGGRYGRRAARSSASVFQHRKSHGEYRPACAGLRRPTRMGR